MRNVMTALGLALAASFAPAASAFAVERGLHAPLAQMPEGNRTIAPFAYSRFCVRSPTDCAPGIEAELPWTAAMRALVLRVNRDVNRAITPRGDRREHWDADVKSGDCEDFALTKRRRLVQLGLPTSSLRIAVARTAEGEGHAVLVVRSAEGDFVLDNRFDRIDRWQDAGLTWIKMTSGPDPRVWRTVGREAERLSENRLRRAPSS